MRAATTLTPPSLRALAAGLVLLLAASTGCSLFGWGRDAGDAPVPDPAFGVQVAGSDSVLDFHQRTASFYGRLAQRRFNSRATYRDPELRGFFQSENAFSDYYADLAQALYDAAFARNRPLALDVVEFSFDAPGRARVRIRMVGDDSRPLRPGRTILEREDRWDRVDGSWWVVPGKL